MPPSVPRSAASAAVPPSRADATPDAAPVDAGALRRWAGAALAVLGRHREEIDALNVFPIADSDTGTNMYLTFEAACRALDDRLAASGPAPSVPEALQALAHGALLGARGNSGVILSQLLRGAAGARYTGSAVDGAALAAGLAAGAESAYEAVARPAPGTILSVAAAAAQAASAAVVAIGELTAASAQLTANDSLAYVAQATAAGAREALARTPDQLDVLRQAGVVDAGGLGLVVLLDTLAAYTGGLDPRGAFRQRRLAAAPALERPPAPARTDPEFEVIYLVEATDTAIAELRRELDEFCERGGGDSLVVVGGDGLWRVHVHVDDAGVPLEAGIAAGRPRDIQITHLASQAAPHAEPPSAAAGSGFVGVLTVPAVRPTRAVVAVAYGDGIAGLLESAGAHVLRAEPGRPPSAADFERAVAAARASEVVLLSNDAETTAVAAAVAERLSAGQPSMRVAAVPAKVTVQGIAALAVHEPSRRFDADVVAMTAAAGATRYGAIEVAATEAWTMAGVCRPGQVLGHVENDVALIEDDQAAAAEAVLERMLSAGGEMVTLVVGDGAEAGVPEAVTERVRARHPVVDVVVYEGGQTGYPLLIGVE
ncbi:DAK2 domain fusion protein YloV [Catenulispora sp. EB89]|uniref:DAK2 domain-containing protein n=1 Tax=Catenulispora sp. EB89 TaxID=3156257 RepID=UPI003516154E